MYPDLLLAQTTLVHEIQARSTSVDLVKIEPETPKFSPTVILSGEAVFGFSNAFGKESDEITVFGGSVELIFNASFTGEDSLEVGIESGNFADFRFNEEITNEGRLEFLTTTEENRFELSELSYEFPIGDRVDVYLSTTGNDISDFNPFQEDGSNSSSDSAISEFGTENPIHNLVEDVGLQINCDLTDNLHLGLGYFSEEGNNPESGAGLFNGNHSAFAQLELEPNDNLLLGFTYIRTYNDSSLTTDTGSQRAQVNLERPIIGNSYGIGASWLVNSRIAIGGWAGYTNATVIDLGNAEIWNYALTVNFPDFGKEGNLLGFVLGQEPRLTGTSGFTIDDRTKDPDTSFHLEAFYRNRVNDYLSITPGMIWITAPNGERNNADIFLLTIRTKFEF